MLGPRDHCVRRVLQGASRRKVIGRVTINEQKALSRVNSGRRLGADLERDKLTLNETLDY